MTIIIIRSKLNLPISYIRIKKFCSTTQLSESMLKQDQYNIEDGLQKQSNLKKIIFQLFFFIRHSQDNNKPIDQLQTKQKKTKKELKMIVNKK